MAKNETENMTKEQIRTELQTMKDDARENDPKLYEAMCLVDQLKPAELKTLIRELQKRIEQMETQKSITSYTF